MVSATQRAGGGALPRAGAAPVAALAMGGDELDPMGCVARALARSSRGGARWCVARADARVGGMTARLRPLAARARTRVRVHSRSRALTGAEARCRTCCVPHARPSRATATLAPLACAPMPSGWASAQPSERQRRPHLWRRRSRAAWRGLRRHAWGKTATAVSSAQAASTATARRPHTAARCALALAADRLALVLSRTAGSACRLTPVPPAITRDLAASPSLAPAGSWMLAATAAASRRSGTQASASPTRTRAPQSSRVAWRATARRRCWSRQRRATRHRARVSSRDSPPPRHSSGRGQRAVGATATAARERARRTCMTSGPPRARGARAARARCTARWAPQ